MHRKAGMAELALPIGERMPIQSALERLIALGYGVGYDAVVRGFTPYQKLLDEISVLVDRSRSVPDRSRPLRVLDISCGTGTVAMRLARDGHAVVGLDAVERLITVAESARRAARDLDLAFHHADVAGSPIPGTGTYDVVVSMHTLYWHPDPGAVVAACRRALKPGGHGVFLTYGRPARIGHTFSEIRAVEGIGAAVRALRWLVPTAIFEAFRDFEPRYMSEREFHGSLTGAGFEVLESRRTFLAGLSRLAWVRNVGSPARPGREVRR